MSSTSGRTWWGDWAVAIALGGGVVICALPVSAASVGQEIQGRQADLGEVKNRLRSLQKEIADTEHDRSEAADAVAKAEQAVSAASRKLATLAKTRQAVQEDLVALETERRAIDRRIGDRQADLAAWLRRYYTHHEGTRVARLFDAGDANEVARMAFYVQRAGMANRDLVEGLRDDLASKERVAEKVKERNRELAELAEEQRKEADTLERVQAERKTALAALSTQLATQRKAAGDLQRDEARLGQLIAGLQKIAREQAAKAAAARAAEARRQAAADDAARRAAAPGPAVGSVARARPEPAEAVVGRVERIAPASPTGVQFAQLQGRLPAPIRGEIIGRFGASRAGGGTTWKGIFIRAASGAEVRAVAAGEVVFSDWLRGFGNLIIVDHGADFLTIYGNNDALLRTNGQHVSAGDPVASVGASGGAGESGLYFEIRRQGQALDPMKWIRVN
ncbi:MAG: peptidoglycan DD-metalloendopeptidase family protein [Zoogloeaceae bacterium]|nr:peptidoglycan DD-metalloendopeptidase family protein [Zoogloeaceae bacterium]